MVFVAGGVTPPEVLYGPLLAALGDRVDPVLLTMAVDATSAVRPGYRIDDEIAAIADATAGSGSHPVDVVAFSGGCTGALGFAALHPSQVRSLMLAEPPWLGNDDWHPQEEAYRRRIDRAIELSDLELPQAFGAALVEPDVPAPFTMPPGTEGPGWCRAFDGMRVAWRRWRQEEFDRTALHKLRAPVHLPVGELSTHRMRRGAELLRSLVHTASIDLLPGLHHFNLMRGGAGFLAVRLEQLWREVG